jgi:hypothetical protein
MTTPSQLVSRTTSELPLRIASNHGPVGTTRYVTRSPILLHYVDQPRTDVLVRLIDIQFKNSNVRPFARVATFTWLPIARDDGTVRIGPSGTTTKLAPSATLMRSTYRSRKRSISGFCWPPSISIIVPLTKCARSEAR